MFLDTQQTALQALRCTDIDGVQSGMLSDAPEPAMWEQYWHGPCGTRYRRDNYLKPISLACLQGLGKMAIG